MRLPGVICIAMMAVSAFALVDVERNGRPGSLDTIQHKWHIISHEQSSNIKAQKTISLKEDEVRWSRFLQSEVGSLPTLAPFGTPTPDLSGSPFEPPSLAPFQGSIAASSNPSSTIPSKPLDTPTPSTPFKEGSSTAPATSTSKIPVATPGRGSKPPPNGSVLVTSRPTPVEGPTSAPAVSPSEASSAALDDSANPSFSAPLSAAPSSAPEDGSTSEPKNAAPVNGSMPTSLTPSSDIPFVGSTPSPTIASPSVAHTAAPINGSTAPDAPSLDAPSAPPVDSPTKGPSPSPSVPNRSIPLDDPTFSPTALATTSLAPLENSSSASLAPSTEVLSPSAFPSAAYNTAPIDGTKASGTPSVEAPNPPSFDDSTKGPGHSPTVSLNNSSHTPSTLLSVEPSTAPVYSSLPASSAPSSGIPISDGSSTLAPSDSPSFAPIVTVVEGSTTAPGSRAPNASPFHISTEVPSAAPFDRSTPASETPSLGAPMSTPADVSTLPSSDSPSATPSPDVSPPTLTTSSSSLPSAGPATSGPTAHSPIHTELTGAPVPASGDCVVSLSIVCDTNDGGTACSSIPPLVTQCQSQPFEMLFKYSGGDCSQSVNIQTTDLFECYDFNDGPPTDEDEISFIVATDGNGNSNYFTGFVPVGGDFLISNGGKALADIVNVTIYSSNTTDPSKIIQTIVYGSACDDDLFLKDRLGSLQVVAFANGAQGNVSSFAEVTYRFDIAISGDFDVELVSLVSMTNFGSFNLTDAVHGQIVKSGDWFHVTQNSTIDLTQRQRYTALGTIVAQIPGGNDCVDSDFLSFVAGNPLAPVFPSLAPSAVPTTTPKPTPNPSTSACKLQGLIRCQVVEGSGTNCRGLAAPTSTQCTGESRPTNLQFIYSGGNCTQGSNSQNGFLCSDAIGGPNSAQQVFIVVASDNDSPFFSSIVDLGELFLVDDVLPNNVTVVISTVNDDGTAGQTLQTMTLQTSCRDDEDLTLLKTFGALQLVAFTNDAQGANGIFTTIRMSYSAENEGTLPASVNSAIRTSSFSGSEDLITTPITLGNGNTSFLGFEEASINLADSISQTFEFTLQINGTYVAGGTVCSDSDTFAFSIA